MKYFTGIDVSLRFVSICVVDEAGVVQYEGKVPAEVDLIVAALRRFSAEVRQVGLEAGTLTQYLTYGLQKAGYEVLCLEARQTAATLAAMRNKTDRNDARGLAQILRSGWYRTVHVKSLESHQVRALLASRKAILTKCVDLENELRGLLKIFGVRLASQVAHGSFDQTVRAAVSATPELSMSLLPLLDARTVLYKTYLKSRNVAAHFGLTPRRYQSGETDNPGRISKAGDVEVRQALYTAAHAMLTRSYAWSTLKAWGLRLAKVRGLRRAVIAVARKLAVILHRMWVDGTDFRASRPQEAA